MVLTLLNHPQPDRINTCLDMNTGNYQHYRLFALASNDHVFVAYTTTALWDVTTGPPLLWP